MNLIYNLIFYSAIPSLQPKFARNKYETHSTTGKLVDISAKAYRFPCLTIDVLNYVMLPSVGPGQ